MKFQSKLDELLFQDNEDNEQTIRDIFRLTYDKIMEDRNLAKKLYDKVMEYQTNKEGKNVRPEISMADLLRNYMILMKSSNQQLLEILKIAERLINAGKEESQGNTNSSNVLEEEEDQLTDSRMEAIQGGK